MPVPKSSEPCRLSQEIAHREIEGQILILLPDDSYLYTLNQSGQFLWERILKGQCASQLSSDLVEYFEIPTAQASKDVRAFLSQLKRKGIILNQS